MKEEEEKETKKLSDYLKFMDDVKMMNIREALKEVEDVRIQALNLLFLNMIHLVKFLS